MKNKIIILSSLASTLLLGATPNIGDIEKQVKPPKIKKEQAVLAQIGTREYKSQMVDISICN